MYPLPTQSPSPKPAIFHPKPKGPAYLSTNLTTRSSAEESDTSEDWYPSMAPSPVYANSLSPQSPSALSPAYSTISPPQSPTAITYGMHAEPCLACGDLSAPQDCLEAPCGHLYCGSCTVDLVRAYCNDESLHPLRCCKTSIPSSELENVLVCMDELTLFRDKLEEYNTPFQKRIYCPRKDCNHFIKPALSAATGTTRCPACLSLVCSLCKEFAHPGEGCEVNKNTARLQQLAKEKEWQTCSNCHRIVERIDGCLHMICLCGYEFCYRCGAKYTGPGMCGH